jgi:hypothetical protein
MCGIDGIDQEFGDVGCFVASGAVDGTPRR